MRWRTHGRFLLCIVLCSAVLTSQVRTGNFLPCLQSAGAWCNRSQPFEGPLLRTWRSSLPCLRGGFDVWNDDDEERTTTIPVAGSSARQVRKAAREAAAVAAAYQSKAKPGHSSNQFGKDDQEQSSSPMPSDSNEASSTVESSQVDASTEDGDVKAAASDSTGGDEDEYTAEDLTWGDRKPVMGADVKSLFVDPRKLEDPNFKGNEDLDDFGDVDIDGGWSEEEGAEAEAAVAEEEGLKGLDSEERQESIPRGEDNAAEGVGIGAAGRAQTGGRSGGEAGEEEKRGGDGEDKGWRPNAFWFKRQYQPAWLRQGGESGGAGRGGRKEATKKLKDLRRSNAISEAEFSRRKAALKGEGDGGGGKEGVEEVGEGLAEMQVGGAGAARELVPLEEVELPRVGGSCNMDGSADPHYRYTMPALHVKVEGATKMIKSVLLNIDAVAAAVGRPPQYLVTYLGQECSSMSQIDKKASVQGRAWVSGRHEQRGLQRLVFKFIRETVLCRRCCNPETEVRVSGNKKRKAVALDCKSCGHQSPLAGTSRFISWMALHPPEQPAWGQVRADGPRAAGAEEEGVEEERGGTASETRRRRRHGGQEGGQREPGAEGGAGRGKEEEEEAVGGSPRAPVPVAAAADPRAAAAVADKLQGGDGGPGAALAGVGSGMTAEEAAAWKVAEAKRLKGLLKAGAISDDQYQQQKAQALERYRALKSTVTEPVGADASLAERR